MNFYYYIFLNTFLATLETSQNKQTYRGNYLEIYTNVKYVRMYREVIKITTNILKRLT